MRGADNPIDGLLWLLRARRRLCRARVPMLYTPESRTLPGGVNPMAHKPVAIDHVNIFVRNAQRSYEWYRDIFGFYTQDIFYHQGTEKPRAVFLSADPDHAHDIALFEVGEQAALQDKGQVGLNHVAWRMETLDDLKEMYGRLQARGVKTRVADHTISLGVYFSDPDGNGLEVYYELPRSE